MHRTFPAAFCRVDAAKGMSSKVAAVSTNVASAVGSAIGNFAAGTAVTAKKAGVAPEGSTSHKVLRTCKLGAFFPCLFAFHRLQGPLLMKYYVPKVTKA